MRPVLPERCASSLHAVLPQTRLRRQHTKRMSCAFATGSRSGGLFAEDSGVKVALCSSKTLRMTIPGLLLALEMSGQSDAELARRLQRRDPNAMADLYDRFGRLAWSVIVAIVHDAATAEDLVQETFLRVWNQAHAFEPGRGALGPWLLAVARNRAIDHVRSKSARMDRNAYELDVREHPSLFVNMEREVLNSDAARVIRKAISTLNEKQQKVIELAYYEGLSQTEMADRMGEPLGTVKTWVRTALKHLREELGEGVTA
jgi:RNA polymerase sigma-70 factor, ECF subfamily